MAIVYPEDRKKKLDALFRAFSIVASDTYVYLCDMRYDYSRWTKRAVDEFGLPSDYMSEAGLVWEEHIHPDDREVYHDMLDKVFSGESIDFYVSYRARKANGDYVMCTGRGMVLLDDESRREYFCGIIRNHEVRGHLDVLTGLKNQYSFFEDIQEGILRHNSMCVCMIGIRKFTEINEIYGYDFGNIVLQMFGKQLADCMDNHDMVYHLDGTRFAVICPDTEKEKMYDYYEKVREWSRNGFKIDGKCVLLELAAGLLAFDRFVVDNQVIFSCLNYAYEQSKLRKQGNLVEFFNTLTDGSRESLQKLHVIRASIKQDYEGFYVLYQPVMDSVSEKLIGAEALIRWKNTQYGTVPPDLFIPVLESDPVFPELGTWVLRRAIRDAKKIRELESDFLINVNLSYSQIEEPDFVDMVLDILKIEDFPPECLCLEITERCRLLDMGLLRNTVEALRSKGVKFALDDFGTGFSSVGLVKSLPLDTIKIDKSFVNGIEDDEKARKLISHFMAISAIYGAKVCVEGIENEQVRDILRQYEVKSFQGYYYSKPIELTDLIELIRKSKTLEDI